VKEESSGINTDDVVGSKEKYRVGETVTLTKADTLIFAETVDFKCLTECKIAYVDPVTTNEIVIDYTPNEIASYPPGVEINFKDRCKVEFKKTVEPV